MDDIRINSVDSDYLVLETQDGQQFRLLNDEALTSAVRKVSSGSQTQNLITPREIQEAVRSGVTVDSLVSSSGATYEFIEKFAAPVLDELAHIIESASAVRFSPDAKGESESFGAMISAKLQSKNASAVTWSASRIDLGQWQVSVHYELSSGTELAKWSFDSRHLVLVPLDEPAMALSRHSQTPAGFLTSPSTPPATSPDLAPAAPVKLAVVTEAHIEPEETPSEPTNLSATADLLQALRQKRAQAQEESAQEPVADKAVSADDTETVLPEKQAEPKKGRAAMPSWDQIVFGTKTDD